MNEKTCERLEQSHKVMVEGIDEIIKNAVSMLLPMDVRVSAEEAQYFADAFQQFDAYAFCMDTLRCSNGRCVVRRMADWVVATFRGSEFSVSCDDCQLATEALRHGFQARWLHKAMVMVRQDYIAHADGCDEKCVSTLDNFLTEITTEFKDTDFCEVMKFCGKKGSGASLGVGSSRY